MEREFKLRENVEETSSTFNLNLSNLYVDYLSGICFHLTHLKCRGQIYMS